VAERIQTQTERADAIKAKQAEMQAVRADRKAAFQAAAQTRLTNLAANISNRMDAAAGRLQNVIDRLTSRIAKLNDQGVDTASASASLSTAQQELDRAKVILRGIDGEVASFIGSENPRESWQSLKTTYTSARDALRASHQALLASVASLKAAVIATDSGRGASTAVSNGQATTTE
jgi:hypothetical protein